MDVSVLEQLGFDIPTLAALAVAIPLLVEAIKTKFKSFFIGGRCQILSAVVTSVIVLVQYYGFANLPVPIQLILTAALIFFLGDGLHQKLNKYFKKPSN